MLQLSAIRENSAEIIKRLAIKNFDAAQIVAQIMLLDDKRKALQKELDACLQYQNQLAKQTGDLFKQGKAAQAVELKEKSAALKETSKMLGEQLTATEVELQAELVKLPNAPSEKVPAGKTPADNEIIFSSPLPIAIGTPRGGREHGSAGSGSPPPRGGAGGEERGGGGALPHWELATKYNIIDFELGAKLTGAGFPLYKGKGARLQRALINYFLDKAIEAGYTEVQPPILVNEASAFATGQLPDKEGQMYFVGMDNFYLIPTAEVPVTNIFRDVILNADELPQKLTAYTPCFRREAGSYGKYVRGLNRLHQFDKVEIVRVEHPDNSYNVLEEMKEYVAGLLEQLELPYRVLRLCGGDMSFASALTYDLEVYSAAQQKWLEVSSVSNFETFQSNRLKLRFRNSENKPQLAHTLNGSALALPRIVAALLENNQTPEGIKIPKALVPYTGFEMIK